MGKKQRGSLRKSAKASPRPAPSGLLRPREVLEKASISHQVLYRYVTLGLVEPAGLTGTGQRLYHPNVLEMIKIIQDLNQTGYSLRDLKEIFFKDERIVRLTKKPCSPSAS